MVARTAFEEVSVAIVPMACSFAGGCRNRRAVALEHGRIVADTSHAALASVSRQVRRHRFRRASIEFAEYRTPGLYSRNQPRTNIVL